MTTPQFQSMQLPQRLPLVISTSNRNSDTDKDARLVNCYVETDQEQGRLFIYKRPGFQSASIVADSQVGQGSFNWEGDVYTIFNGKLYRNGTQVGTGMDVPGGKYKFSSILGATPKLLMNNGNQGYAYDTLGGLSANLHSINASYPETTVKGWAYLNGAEYVMNPQAVIWGSDPNDVTTPGAWDALNFISAQSEPDNGVAMDRQLVYVVAFNEWSTEVFFDAGNPTGSPLGPVEGSRLSYGCAQADSVQRIDDCLFWLSVNQTSSNQVAMMQQLQMRIISTKPIDKLIAGADLTHVLSWQVKFDGHSFYVITLKDINLTLAYDIVENRWCQWVDVNGNYLPYVDSTYDQLGRLIIQHESNGRLYFFSSEFQSDTTDPIVMDIFTPTFDAGTRRRKQLGMMQFVCDKLNGSNLYVRYSDDDYQTWSNWRVADLGQDLPYLPHCGTFTRRAWNFQHRQNLPFRMEAVELQYDVGTL